MDGRIVRCGIISSCQSAVTSEIVKRFWSRVWLMKERYSKYPNFTFTFTFTVKPIIFRASRYSATVETGIEPDMLIADNTQIIAAQL